MANAGTGTGADDRGNIPEVEAELVADGSGEAREEIAAEKGAVRKRVRTARMTPGLALFIVFIITTIGLITMWLSQPTNRDAGAQPIAEELTSSSPALSPKENETPSEPAAAAVDSGTSPLENDKIVNRTDEISSGAVSTLAQPEKAGRGLPSAGSVGAAVIDNEDIRRSAKDAVKLISPPPPDAHETVSPGGGIQIDALVMHQQALDQDLAEEAIASQESPGRAGLLDGAMLKGDNLHSNDYAQLAAELADLRAAQERSRMEIAALNAQISETLLHRDERAAEELAGLRAQISTLFADRREETGASRLDTSAFIALRLAVESGRPYAEELKRLPATASRSFAVAALQARAHQGLTTHAALLAGFEVAAREALAAAARESAKGVFGELQARFLSLFSIRPAYPKAGDSADATIARAEMKVRENDLAAALLEIERLEGGARTAFSDWAIEARARLDSDAAMRRLEGDYLAPITN